VALASRNVKRAFIMLGRSLFAILIVTAVAGGCRTCDNPYDYCGPVVDSDSGLMGFRSGSSMASPGMAPEEIPSPPPPPTAPSDSPGVAPSDAPRPTSDMDTTSAMRTRLRYAR
jgi:hypothetical protein